MNRGLELSISMVFYLDGASGMHHLGLVEQQRDMDRLVIVLRPHKFRDGGRASAAVGQRCEIRWLILYS
jgi:hypothetical protein